MCDHMDLVTEVTGTVEYWEGDEYLCKDIISCDCPDCGCSFLLDDGSDLG
jgi:hypothetical protein